MSIHQKKQQKKKMHTEKLKNFAEYFSVRSKVLDR